MLLWVKPKPFLFVYALYNNSKKPCLSKIHYRLKHCSNCNPSSVMNMNHYIFTLSSSSYFFLYCTTDGFQILNNETNYFTQFLFYGTFTCITSSWRLFVAAVAELLFLQRQLLQCTSFRPDAVIHNHRPQIKMDNTSSLPATKWSQNIMNTRWGNHIMTSGEAILICDIVQPEFA